MTQVRMNADMRYAEGLLRRKAELRQKEESRNKKSPAKPARLA